MKRYETGKISITQNSNIVTGLGTRWLSYVRSGDELTVNGQTFIIESVADFNQLTLAENYLDADVIESSYYITETDNIARAREAKEVEILNAYREDISIITNQYDKSEIDTWTKQEADSRAFIADNNADVPFLNAHAIARGKTKLDLAQTIIANADTYTTHVATALGKKQKLIEEIETATLEQVKLIQW